jgi:tRNA threonylcarbamoyladenosine biosynthesis protein TsaB
LRDINLVLTAAGLSLGNVELFAAASGPGSFTGLRIGLATVKALAMTLHRPCAGIPTLQAIAHAAGPSAATVAALPAGRGEVFAQLLFVSPEGEVAELEAPAPLSPNAMIERYGPRANLVWAGQGAQIQREFIRNGAAQRGVEFSDQPLQGAAGRRGWVLAERAANLAQNIAALARQRFQRSDVDTPAALQAIYVRLSDAELTAQCR